MISYPFCRLWADLRDERSSHAATTGRAEHDDGAGKEHRAQSRPPGEQPERGAAEPKRHVKKDGVGAHREAAALRRGAVHSFNAKARIDE